MQPELIDVDPKTLHLPNSRRYGADPGKLQRQIARFGRSTIGMPQILAYRGSDGTLMLTDGATRATRVAKLCPGETVPVEVIDTVPHAFSHLPTVGDKLP